MNEDLNQPKTELNQPISWQAAEEAQPSRGTVWYIVFVLVLIGLLALAIFVFKSITFAILLPVMAVAVIVLSNRKPVTLNYSISPKGVYVGDKLHDFSEFRSFGIIQGQSASQVILLPVKRFSNSVTLNFDNTMGEQIVDMLGARLPIQEIKPDSLEKLIDIIRL